MGRLGQHQPKGDADSSSSLLQKIFDLLIQIPGDLKGIRIVIRSQKARHSVIRQDGELSGALQEF